MDLNFKKHLIIEEEIKTGIKKHDPYDPFAYFNIPVEGAEEFIKLKSPDKSWMVKRVTHNDRELAFAEHWANECKPKSWLNYGFGLAQNLFMYRKNNGLSSYSLAKIILNKREKMIAATCMQWLGTNCGWAFLMEALRKCGYKIVKLDN